MSHPDQAQRSRRPRNEEAASYETVGEAARACAEPSEGIFDELGTLAVDMTMPGASIP
jgi:hypothetical protein